MTSGPDLGTLLREAGWLRALARTLVEPAAVDDVLQDTWLASLRQPPDAERPVRPWLACVVTNLARNRRRDEARRRRRDALAAAAANGGTGAADPAELAEAAELQRRLATAVTRLAPPLQAVVVLCCFRGLDSATAGRQLGIPASTVRTRHQRAIEELRTALDAETPGGRAAWSTIALGFLPGAPVPVARAAAAAALAVPAAIALVAVLGGIYFATRPVAVVPESHAADARTAAARGAPSDERDTASHASERRAAGAAFEAAPLPGARGELGAAADLAGRVLVDGEPPGHELMLRLLTDDDARALAAADVAAPGEPRERRPALREQHVPMDANGAFRFAGLPAGWRGRLFVDACTAPGGAPSLPVAAGAADVVLHVHAGPRITGRIDLRDGGPLALDGRCELRGVDGAVVGDAMVFRARADGSFAVPLPPAAGPLQAVVRVEVDGRAFLHHEVAPFDARRGVDTGALAVEPVRVLTLTIVDDAGRPLPGATARLHRDTTAARRAFADARGTIVIPYAPAGECSVRVHASGHAARVISAPAAHLEVALAPCGAALVRLAPSLRAEVGYVRLTAARPMFVAGAEPERPAGRRTGPGDALRFERSPAVDPSRAEHRFAPATDGTLHVEGLAPGTEVLVEAVGARGAVLAQRAFVVRAGERAELELAPR